MRGNFLVFDREHTATRYINALSRALIAEMNSYRLATGRIMSDQHQQRTILNTDGVEHARNAVKTAPVSVIVPCFRSKATIEDAVASIVAQTLRPAEILLIDDCSGDGTVDVLHSIAARHPVGWIKVIALPSNGGVSHARNTGWNQAQQPYIAFLDADDCWGSRKLELQMAALDADPSIALISHRMVIRPRGTQVPPPESAVNAEVISRRTLLLRNPFPTASVILRRDLPLRFDEKFRRSEDYLLWSQIVFSGHRCVKLDQVLAIWNQRESGESGLSDDFVAVHRARRAMRRELLRQGLLNHAEYVFCSTFGMVTKTRRDIVLRIQRQGPYRPPAAQA
jgi:glycosyltransferase involved in cell wall biosynthesis